MTLPPTLNLGTSSAHAIFPEVQSAERHRHALRPFTVGIATCTSPASLHMDGLPSGKVKR